MRTPGNPSDRRRRDEQSGVIRTEFDWSETAPSVAVVETLAVATNTELLSVDPILDHLDPDALNAVIQHGAENGTRAVVTFGMGGHEVSVYADGRVVLVPVETPV